MIWSRSGGISKRTNSTEEICKKITQPTLSSRRTTWNQTAPLSFWKQLLFNCTFLYNVCNYLISNHIHLHINWISMVNWLHWMYHHRKSKLFFCISHFKLFGNANDSWVMCQSRWINHVFVASFQNRCQMYLGSTAPASSSTNPSVYENVPSESMIFSHSSIYSKCQEGPIS